LQNDLFETVEVRTYNEENMKRFILPLLFLSGMLSAQLTVTSVKQSAHSAKTEQWSNALFSPDGNAIYLTNTEMNGIWEYSLRTNSLRVITSDRYSGFGFSVSPDGEQLAYRTTVREQSAKASRIQQSVVIDLKTLTRRLLEEGSSVDLPFFLADGFAVTQRTLSASSISVHHGSKFIGTNDQGIFFLRNAASAVIDPFEGGKYIWPVLSADSKKIAAVEMSRGAFICNTEGKNIIRIGRCNSPQWTVDSRWVIGMNDVDDGHSITGSEIIAVSADGRTRIPLTDTPSVIELFPALHPSKNEFVVTTSAGDLLHLYVCGGEII
jgi:Tol biopolymer transport system component